LTYMSQENSTNGNPIGMASAVTFKGDGELDNGWGVAMSIAGADGGGYSTTNITITMPGLGDVLVSQGVSGTGIQRMDDITPTVWEEADGAGLSAGINKIAGSSGGATIEVTPTDYMPAGLAAKFAYSRDADSGQVNDKATGGQSGELGAAYDITLTATSDFHTVEGLTIYAGLAEIDQFQNASTHSGDVSERVYGVKYAMGGFTVGYQRTEEDTGQTGTTEYENTSYGVTFNVNDDLSIGYAHTESDETGQGLETPTATSYQAAYTMGGATVRIAEVEVKNQAYTSTAAGDVKATIVSLGLAF